MCPISEIAKRTDDYRQWPQGALCDFFGRWHVATEELVCTAFERTDHDFYGFSEDALHHELEYAGMKFEINEKIDRARIGTFGDENPMIVQISKGSIRVRNIYSIGSAERDG